MMVCAATTDKGLMFKFDLIVIEGEDTQLMARTLSQVEMKVQCIEAGPKPTDGVRGYAITMGSQRGAE
jgi:hypothetical protein